MKSIWAFLGVFLPVVVASPTHDAVEVKLGEKDTLEVSEELIAKLEVYSQYTNAAYCNYETPEGEKIACAKDACPEPEKNEAVIVKSFIGEKSGLGGFVATDPVRSEIIVSFKGSSSFRNWIYNFKLFLIDFNLCDGCQTHTGFQDAWTEVRQVTSEAVNKALAANPSFKVIATGHSLGGAIATFAAGDLRAAGVPVDVYTYGSPRPGNGALVDFITQQPGLEVRVTHVDDPVPRLPPSFLGYRHTSPELWLSTGNATTVDYTVADVLLCEGSLNINCNGGAKGYEVAAHSYYFQFLGGCGGDNELLLIKRDTTLGGSSCSGATRLMTAVLELDREYYEKSVIAT